MSGIDDIHLMEKIGRIDERSLLIYDRLRNIEAKVDELKDKFEGRTKEIDNIKIAVERHRTYFKIIGAAIAAIITIVAATLPAFIKF